MLKNRGHGKGRNKLWASAQKEGITGAPAQRD